MRSTTQNLTPPGLLIAMAIMVLLALGLSSIYVSDTHYAKDPDGPANAAKQCVFALASMIAATVVLRVGYKRVSEHAYAIFALVLIALLPLLIAKLSGSTFGGFIPKRNGAYRWIQLPAFQLQPSEFMKLAFMLALAWYLRFRKNYRQFAGLLLPIIVSAVPLALILLQPDLGTVLLLLPVLFTMLFVAGAKKRHLGAIFLIGLALAPWAWFRLESYQRLRVTAVLLQSDKLREAAGEDDRFAFLATKRQAKEWAGSSGYQLVHSKNAIGSGGLLGNGWGDGVYINSNLLPDRHNDFIFSVIGHQFGFVGCMTVLGCYVVIVLAGVRIATATVEPFGRLLAVGVVALIATQVVISVGMSVGLMPITGMTLPFVSYGGSSLLANFLTIALLISISQHRPYLLSSRPFEFSKRKAARAHLAEHVGTAPLREPPTAARKDR